MEEIKERFVVDTDLKAEWALSKLAELDKTFAEETARLEEQMEWYKQEIKKVKEERDESAAYFEGLLKAYFQTQPHKVTKSGQEKYKLPHGELSMKPQEPVYSIVDTTALVKQLNECETMKKYIKVKDPEVDWRSLKSICTYMATEVEDEITGEIVTGYSVINQETGEIVQGISVLPREPKFTVTYKE